MLLLACVAALLWGAPWAAAPQSARAQVPYDASWYDGSQPYARVAVTESGVHRVSGSALAEAGVPLGQVDLSTLRLLEKGREIPLDVRDANTDGTLSSGDALLFVGRRNRGTDEAYAYNGDASLQSSAYRSLYTDTLTYWLTWGGANGQRYAAAGGDSDASVVRTARDTVHLEQDRRYHFGPSYATGTPLFSLGEGYYWNRMGGSGTQSYTLSLPRVVSAASEEMRLAVRMVGRTGSCHRATLEVDFGSGFETVAEVQWQRYELATLEAGVSQDRLSGSSVEVRVRTHDSGFDDTNCDPSISNGIYVDYVEAAYTRRLAPPSSGQQRFTAASGAPRTYELSGYSTEASLDVFSPATGRRFTPRTGSDGAARFTDDPPSATTSYWAASGGNYLIPARLTYQPAGSRPDWTAPATSAEYVVLTTEAMRASAEELAAYRRSHDGYSAAVVTVEEVFDQFDYGRATPIAIRRFVHYTQSTWATPARFVTLWGDATYPIRTATEQPDAPWNVPAFGYAPSDAWYAMQYDGPDDWSEVVALGRVTIRTSAQAETFLDKLRGYEAGRLSDWQKRYLALSGGTSSSEQRRLEAYNTTWARTAASPPTGMDTLYFSKSSTASLDDSFQDSLDAAFERGAGWLHYFGHSAAQTWEIVTEQPAQFENAGRLPFVVSLGCQTGAFAGGRFVEKPTPSFGEQLLLGMNPNAPLGPGSRNGAIGHFGTSYKGTIGSSAIISDALIEKVFRDSMRIAGLATREAKADVADRGFLSRIQRDHLMQYGLLGEPATHLAVPERPNFHLEASQLKTRPLAPVPSDSLRLTARIKNQGIVPSDSLEVQLVRRTPDGERRTTRRLVPPFRLLHTETFSTFLTEDLVGASEFTVTVDPSDRIDEAREDDNTAQTTQVVSASGLRLVAPRDLGVADANSPTFRLSLSTVSTQAQAVRLEVAADSAFTDVRARDVLDADGPRVTWSPSVSLEAGRTYYWRARLDASEEADAWRTVSFTALPQAPVASWLQRGTQFSANAQERLTRSGGAWVFDTFEREVLASSERGFGGLKGQFNVGGAERYEYLGLGIGVLIVDGTSGRVKASGSYCVYQTSFEDRPAQCTGRVDGAAAVARLDSLLRTTLTSGDHLFTRTRNLGRRSAPFPEGLDPIFQHLGEDNGPIYSQAIDTLSGSDLWIMQARKGFPGETYEQVEPAGSGENEIVYKTRLSFSRAQGRTTTARIGPAREWDALTWEVNFENPADRVRFEVLGSDSTEVLRSATAAPDQSTARLDLSQINSVAHPYLRLRATLTDSTQRTAPQLQRWRLDYTPTAEIALDPSRLEIAPGDTLEEGRQATVRVPVINLTDVASSPVYVRFAVTDSSNQTRTVATDTLDALGPDGSRVAEAQFSTASLAGRNVLTVRAEQRRATGSGAVPEALSYDNSTVKSFFVESDRTAPAVEVRVDGRALPTDPDDAVNLQDPALPFVSLTPTFEITLDDDSEYLSIDDTTFIDVRFGIAPDLQPVSFAGETLEFIPPDDPGDPARALFSPNLRTSARDTVYTLQVEVEDARGNQPDMTYQSHVRVRTEMAVQDLYPYPNPMSTHTRFMFQLRGGDVSDVDELRLRIYTLSGLLVREFRRTAIDLQTGWNAIEWDGRDADGDRLATGVYLYNVRMTGEGNLDVNDGNVEKIAVIR